MEIDYTVMRKGSKPKGHREIVYCQKCNRKGLISYETVRGGEHAGKRMIRVTHHSHIAKVGIPFECVDDHCGYLENA